MRFASLAALTGLAGLAAARITSFAVPKTIKPGEKFDLILMNHNYIQTVDEIAAAFGVDAGEGREDILGPTLVGSVYLGPSKSNEVANYTFPLTVPKKTAEGPVTFTTSLFQLYGVENLPTLTEYTVSIKLGKETSDEYVTSTP